VRPERRENFGYCGGGCRWGPIGRAGGSAAHAERPRVVAGRRGRVLMRSLGRRRRGAGCVMCSGSRGPASMEGSAARRAPRGRRGHGGARGSGRSPTPGLGRRRPASCHDRWDTILRKSWRGSWQGCRPSSCAVERASLGQTAPSVSPGADYLPRHRPPASLIGMVGSLGDIARRDRKPDSQRQEHQHNRIA